MNLEDLRERRRREREQDSLGRLPESFYRDAAEYVDELKRARERAAERADDPYGDPEVRRLTDELDSATSIVESLYERRVGKVVKHASFAAADMPHDDEGLTDEERALFDDLVERIRDNRSRVLGALEGSGGEETADPGAETSAHEATAPNADAGAPDPDAERQEPTGASDGLDAAPTTDDPAGMLAEAMGGGPSDDPHADGGEADERGERDPHVPEAGRESDHDPVTAAEDVGRDGSGASPRDDETAESPTPPGRDGPGERADTRERPGAGERPDDPVDERTTVRITADVGEIYGVDDRSYRLEAEDVVSLPADNATPLVEKDAAERL